MMIMVMHHTIKADPLDIQYNTTLPEPITLIIICIIYRFVSQIIKSIVLLLKVERDVMKSEAPEPKANK